MHSSLMFDVAQNQIYHSTLASNCMMRRRKRMCLLILLGVSISLIYLQSPSDESVRVWSIVGEIHRDDSLYLQSDRCFTSSTASTQQNIRRAILVHFPIDRASVYVSELKWLYLSWIETIRNQPSNWHTDLLIYSLPSSILDQLGCPLIEKRSSKNQCFRIHYQSIWKRSDTNLSRFIQLYVPSWCQHLDSLGILLEQSSLLDQYDYILRTDLDVFLTPLFARYIPFHCSFQIGLGGYGYDYTLNRLSRISQTLNLGSTNLSFIGSTWYAPPKQAVLVARTALWLSIWLSENEFTRIEKDVRLSILSWPQWYIGVVSMYASHLAMHHYATRGQIHLIQKPSLIDYSCTQNTSFHDADIIHIHAWHTNEMFSKFLFKNGSYDALLREKQVWNTNYSLDYILRVAWESQKFHLKDLRHLKTLSESI